MVNVMKYRVICISMLALLPIGELSALSTKYTGNCSILAKESGEYPKRQVSGFKNPGAYKKVTTANQLLADGGAANKAQAKALLLEVKNSSSDKFALSVVNQYLARFAFEANDFNKTVQYAKEVVNLDALPVNSILQMKKQVAWAYLGKKDYKNAINWMKQYFEQVIKPPVSDYKALAQLYYQDNDFRNAICPAYIALNKTTKIKEKESLYKMLYGLHYRLKDMNGTVNVLTEMVGHYPNNKDYWNQLFSIHYQKGDQASALAVSELAYQKGIWKKESEYKNVASLHANNGAPLRAAERIQEGFQNGIVPKSEENLKLVARYLYAAKERDKAIQAYKNVSAVSSKGEYSYRIGNMYFDMEDYQNAIKYFQQAVNKGGLKPVERGNAYLQIGAGQFYLGNENAAIQALQKAKNVDRVRKNATSWIAYIKQKQEVRELLRKEAEAVEAEVAAEKAEAEARVN